MSKSTPNLAPNSNNNNNNFKSTTNLTQNTTAEQEDEEGPVVPHALLAKMYLKFPY